MFGIFGCLVFEMVCGEWLFFVYSVGICSQWLGDLVCQLSLVFFDIVVNNDLLVVLVCFFGGLLREFIEGKFEFFVGYGVQDYFVGCFILVSDIVELLYCECCDFVFDVMNLFGLFLEFDELSEVDVEFLWCVVQWQEQVGVGEVEVVFFCMLEDVVELSEEIECFFEVVVFGMFCVDDFECDLWLVEVVCWFCGVEINC